MNARETAEQLGCELFNQGINRGFAKFPKAEQAKKFFLKMWENVEEWRDIPSYIEGEKTVHWR